MKKILLPILMLLAMVGTSKAQNALTVAGIELPSNYKAALTVSYQFDADDKYVAYQFELELPSDLEFVKDGSIVAFTRGECHEGHTVTTELHGANKVSVGCNYDGTHKLKGTDGMLLEFAIKPSSTLSSDKYTGNIKNVRLSDADGTSYPVSDGTFTVTIVDPIDTRTLLDENSTEAPTTAEEVDVRVKRTINAGNWSTICLPFAMTGDQVKAAFGNDVAIGDSYKYEKEVNGDITRINVFFNNVDANDGIEANHPYILKTSSNISEFTVDKVDISPSAKPYVEYDNGKTGRQRKIIGVFAGTYVADFDLYNEVTDYYPLFLNNNKFYYARANSKHMKAFRAYFGFDDYLPEADEDSSARVFLSIDDESTKIDARTMEPIETGKVYNIAGQYVGEGEDMNRLPKGIYIVNGKKVIK